MTRSVDIELEAFLARIYVDASERAAFVRDPCGRAQQAGLSADAVSAVCDIDLVGLELAARSFEHKRRAPRVTSMLDKLRARFAR